MKDSFTVIRLRLQRIDVKGFSDITMKVFIRTTRTTMQECTAAKVVPSAVTSHLVILLLVISIILRVLLYIAVSDLSDIDDIFYLFLQNFSWTKLEKVKIS